jgi:hypothetical protein
MGNTQPCNFISNRGKGQVKLAVSDQIEKAEQSLALPLIANKTSNKIF